MKKIFLITAILLAFTSFTKSQVTISGQVFDSDSVVLPGAIIRLSYTKSRMKGRWIFKRSALANVSTMTDINGNYTLTYNDTTIKYVKISSMSMKTKTFEIRKLPKKIYLVKSKVKDKPIMVKKPVIYLYPQKKTLINIKLNYNGKLTTTYPVYNSSWNVSAKPNGDLVNIADKTKHKYLFWEGKLDDNFVFKNLNNGFVIEGENTLKFLDITLTKLGLNQYEKNDFITFWLPKMQQNKYNFIHFYVNSECNKIAKLSITPKPDNEIRVYMVFNKLDNYLKIKPQKLPTIIRKGYIAVEWGGSEIDNYKLTVEK